MKKDHSQKKISHYDKFQALIRKPCYRADHLDFTFWCRERGINEWEYLDHPKAVEKAEELCKKYEITRLIHPADKNIPKDWLGGEFIEEKEIVEVIYPTEYRYLSEDELKRGIRPRYLPIPVFMRGNELIIKIDLNADKEVIVEKITEQLNYFHYFIPRNKSRMTPDRKIDKWEVYDTYNQMKSFEKTAHKINERASAYARFLNRFGITVETPKKLNISTVRKAYYRAFELVYGEKFDPNKHKPEKLPVKLRRTCDKCPEYSTCKALCPEVLKYYLQDEEYQRETPKPEQELDILSSEFRSLRKKPKPSAE
jgi:hypothetical protein